ncbi:methylmalonyl-CoA mutase family protein [Actinomycetospora endophytica]|uniref:Methylmalonyl-CoA mutase family protein n=1 Tax=Actinomycetospora endophytica TaxID=2291215 RepID=A0ABS8P6V1_9PSEU|nr:methylmalonyl-CoA mutase family protein [Actinomycetospora endophytica]MCD2193968.1 methylmalonyl-CoA mutase family protein [Actinomycetospora endophytica]
MTAGPDTEQSGGGPSGTPAAPEELTLAAEFDTPARARWRELVAEALSKSGREVQAEDAEAAIATATDDGFDIAALYTAEDAPDVPTGAPGLPPFTRASRPEGHVAEGWYRRQRHAFGADIAPKDAHETLMADLENGVSSLWLVLGDAGGPPVDALPALLEGVFLDLAPVGLEAGRDTPDAAATLLRLASEHGVTTSLGGSLGYDPLLARTHGGAALTDAFTESMVEHSRTAAAQHPSLATLVADGLPYHEAGGSDGQELGAALAAGLHAVRVLNDAGLSVDDAFARVEFRLAATADQFSTLAKLRAARRCWERIGSVAGASAEARAMRQHAVTSPAMMTARDPWVNILRTTIAAVGAGLGGADAVTVLPFDTALGLPDDFALRIARNTQALLLEESHLAHVIDPAGGSWCVESLTDALAHAAWEVFTTVEGAGGIEAALDDGSLAVALEETWTARADRIGHRKDPITGVSEFPNLHESLPSRTPSGGPGEEAGGLPRRRYAQVFEVLRDRADAQQERPQAFLATVGALAQYTARASFATNLLHAGGIDVVDGPGGTGIDEIVAAFRESGTTVAVVASSDKVYAEHAAPLATALAEAGATRVLLAGSPKTEGLGPDDGTALTGYLYTGCDAAALLTDLLDVLTGEAS